MAAALAAPSPTPLPPAESTELRDFDPRQAWSEVGLLAASIVKPRSPRSPRVLAADQAAMIDALCAEGEGKGEKAAAVPLLVVDEENVTALTPGFDDPLGANRWAASPARDGERHDGIELELLDGRQQDT